MYFVMAEISNYRQLTKLRGNEAAEIRGLLEHFCLNRGGKLVREQTGFFLFSFHPLREKVLEQVADFLFLTGESLQKKKDELFGFSLLLDQGDPNDDGAVFNRMKAQLFQTPRENRIWVGPSVLSSVSSLLPVSDDEPLAEILGPPSKVALPPLPVELLLEMTGWIEALKAPLSRQLADSEDRRPGKILRLKGTHLSEKYLVLKTVLHQIYGPHEDFPVLFPLEDSKDVLSQLLARVNLEFLKGAPRPVEPAWEALLLSRGGGDYPGDSGKDDVLGALTHYFRQKIRRLAALNLPPVFVFLFPHRYEPEAQVVLETILGDLVASEGLRLLLLEHQEKGVEFLSRSPSLSWQFPGLNLERILRERDARDWKDRFPTLTRQALDSCDGRGMAWVHHLWSLQEGNKPSGQGDPSWNLLQNLDSSHHKVYYVLWAGRGLLEERQLVDFFQQWGEDAAVIQDKVNSLRAMGYFLAGLPQPLRSDFGALLSAKLGEEGRELLVGLGRYLYKLWLKERRLSEVLFLYLREWGLHKESLSVLSYYLTNKINQGQGDFLSLLRKDLWEVSPTEELRDKLRLLAASAKLRFALNLGNTGWAPSSLDRFRRFFTPRTENNPGGEWQLQQGRFYLRVGDLATGFAFLKEALLDAQDSDNASLEVRSETEIGLALLRKHRLEEAREYFEIASRLAEKTGSSYLVSQTAALDALASFLLGHLAAAKQAVEQGFIACDRGGLQRNKMYLSFLRGRIEFDQGDYTAAALSLDHGLSVASRYRFAEAEPVLAAWKGRAEAYSGNGAGARLLLEALAPSAERSYFLAETHWFDHEHEGAWKRIMEARTLLPATQPFGAGERAAWSSGFAGVEDRALAKPGDIGVLQNQVEAFQWLLEGTRGQVAEASRGFQELLGRKFLLDLDPVSAQYYYWYYLVLPKNDSKQEAQRLTLLGRSLKDVQVRASRIEEPSQRQDYLTKPYWNTQFSLEGRKLKLL